MMNIKLQPKMKSLLWIVLFFIGILLLFNTNNNPNTIIQRIFRPIHIGNGTIFYAAIFPMVIIYYSLKGLYKQGSYNLLNTRAKRIIILILIIAFLPDCIQSGIKAYKSFYSNLNSIYCYRDSMNLSIESKDNKQRVFCNLELQNCSSKKMTFNVKVDMPKYFDEFKGTSLTNKDNIIILNPHERSKIEITLAESDVNCTGNTISSTSNFQFSLYNAEQEVKFIQSDDN